MPLIVALSGARHLVGTSVGSGVDWAHQSGSRRAFVLGLITGIGYFAGTLYWITGLMTTYGGLAWPTAVGVNALLVAFLALFPALFAVTVAGVGPRLGASSLLVVPAIWVTTELGRTHLFGGFPWVLLGYSQVHVLPVAQLSSLFGVYGVSWLVAMISTALAQSLLVRGRERMLVLGTASAILIAVVGWGGWRVTRHTLTEGSSPSIRVALVQGNIAQHDKRDPTLRPSILETYLTLSREATAGGARLVIWPEAATPFPFEENVSSAAAVRELAVSRGVHLLLGSEEIAREPDFRYYNAAFLVRPDGRTGGVYRKMRLVPFGEYVPLARLLFFAGTLVATVADFSPGLVPATLSVDGHRLSTAICYEVVYPDLIRQFVVGGSELLTTITNDAWFGRTSAPYQHFSQAAMRAIEQGRYLVRAANTGISGIVDPYGRVLDQTELFTRDTVIGDVRWLRTRTLYGRTGDLFAYACGVLSMGAVLAVGASRRRRVGG